MTHTAPPKNPPRVGRWLPDSPEAIEAWVHDFAARTEAKGKVPFHPVIQEFQDLIAEDPIVRLYVTNMISQVPSTRAYRKNHLRSVEQMLVLINAVLTQAPDFNTTALVGAPLNAIIDWSMGTPAGFAAFRYPPINAMFRKILNAWCEFLSSPASLYVLNDSPTGWKSPAAIKATNMTQFQYDPSDRYWGFKSWNDFFTRKFKEGMRPVADPDDHRVIVSACESTPYNIQNDVQRFSQFWIKSQPYSLQDMLANDEATEMFVGGCVYQAFLSAYNYHRWHSPVSGTIKKAFVQPGTYYSEAASEGEDPAGPNNSQGYITQVATRAIIHIEADDPGIGRMVLMPVGMAEISSCVIHPHIKPGHKVKKGEEIGFFQYGGSTHCLIFRPGAISSFALQAIPEPLNPDAPLVLLHSRVATGSGGRFS